MPRIPAAKATPFDYNVALPLPTDDLDNCPAIVLQRPSIDNPEDADVLLSTSSKRTRRVEPGHTRRQRPRHTRATPTSVSALSATGGSLDIVLDAGGEEAGGPQPHEATHQSPWDDLSTSLNPGHTPRPAELSYELFIESVDAGTCGLFQLSRDIFVVQGWDLKARCSNVRAC